MKDTTENRRVQWSNWFRRGAVGTIVCLLLAGPCVLADDKPKELPAEVSYYKDVRPVFVTNCQGCHQPAKAMGGYVVTSMTGTIEDSVCENSGYFIHMAGATVQMTNCVFRDTDNGRHRAIYPAVPEPAGRMRPPGNTPPALSTGKYCGKKPGPRI